VWIEALNYLTKKYLCLGPSITFNRQCTIILNISNSKQDWLTNILFVPISFANKENDSIINW